MEGEKTKLQPGPINDDDDDDNFLRVHMNYTLASSNTEFITHLWLDSRIAE